jgi:hypothetical protein
VGQLAFVATGVGLVAAGLTIAGVGVTTVLVAEDARFMGTLPEVLRSANDHLLPLIAHDRAGFGGALVSDGIAVLLAGLWYALGLVLSFPFLCARAGAAELKNAQEA